MLNMKGIILAGGSGSRLHPITKGTSKQLLPIYDKPMIYYSISVLMLAKIRDILIISSPEDIISYKRIFKDGSNLGLRIKYSIQNKPEGIAQAFLIADKFIANENVALVLGDNIFHGKNFKKYLLKATTVRNGATIFGYQVNDPERFGVIEFNSENKVVSIEEKPDIPKSDYAVTGLYFYDNNVVKIAKSLKPSDRGEVEITDINNIYLENQELKVINLDENFTWLDTGTYDSLIEASIFVRTYEQKHKSKIGCIEEISFNNDWISRELLIKNANNLKNSPYGKYLLTIAGGK